jgi:hypothetical protein
MNELENEYTLNCIIDEIEQLKIHIKNLEEKLKGT